MMTTAPPQNEHEFVLEDTIYEVRATLAPRFFRCSADKNRLFRKYDYIEILDYNDSHERSQTNRNILAIFGAKNSWSSMARRNTVLTEA